MLAMDAELTRLKPVSGTFRAINGRVRGELRCFGLPTRAGRTRLLQKNGVPEMRWRELLVSWVTRP